VRPRTIAFVIAAILGAALFARLGVWQVSRLHERQARNGLVREKLVASPVPVDSLRGPSSDLQFRRATVHGLASYNGESMLVQRTHDGSPGVFLLTPVRTGRGDSATLVVRGWVYAPDGVTIDRARWQEGDSVTIEGWLDVFPTPRGPDTLPGHPDALRRLDRATLARHAGIPLRPLLLWATGPAPTNPAAGIPARFPLPELDEGPHRSYAIQWFSFAAIALVGAGVVVHNDRRTKINTERDAGTPVTRV
jgi:surfeit locus 1 family protein